MTARPAGRIIASGVLLTAVTVAVTFGPGGAASAAPGEHGIRGIGPYKAPATEYVKDSYIVVFKDAKVSKAQVGATVSRLGTRFNGRVGHTYSNVLRGFSVEMSAEKAKQIAAEPEVERVEQVQVTTKSDTQTNPSWGLDRIDEYALPLNHQYTYPGSAGGDVHAYVIDTGIRATHPEFQGRVTSGRDFVENDNDADDCDGHGTHVAGTIGGQTFGVAKGVRLHSVRVLGCDGRGTVANLIAGVDWVTANAVKPAVVNMSVGLNGISAALDTAVTASIASGLTYAVAAGNAADDACDYSPSRVPDAITVGATDEIDYAASFSNLGDCLDIFAPGVNITSAAKDGGSVAFNGTSMASPHVAGAAALLLSANPSWTPAEVAARLSSDASSSVHHALADSPNRLLNLADATNEIASLSLIARVNARFVSAANTGGSLVANNIAPGATETFQREATGGDTFVLKTGANYVKLNAARQLEASTTDQAQAERFSLVTQGDLSVGLRASDGQFVAAENAGAGALVANRASVGEWETFEKQAPELVVSVKAWVNNSFVAADNGGASPLIANRPSAGQWESFDIVETPDGYIGLRSHANGKYVTAENAGASPLIARSTVIGDWEKFWFVHEGPYVTIFSAANGKIATAENAGASPLIARGDFLKPGEWEFFTRTVRIY
ncbi:hypothetical protein Val02_53060 [Virgisporangium aliadipatigenens]|uniref:Serine protease n=1 Tax=Virgisporangium aliadipatigenens TaxID=741659 RepID=A0A8J3YR21_9ACTN|nr:S8 family serine peptidase [Virgisporangium aliadipatigenens]GIJ48420.1 hypothetical protein Val02_53060 [Virgisporangium aliadipatigenens]